MDCRTNRQVTRPAHYLLLDSPPCTHTSSSEACSCLTLHLSSNSHTTTQSPLIATRASPSTHPDLHKHPGQIAILNDATKLVIFEGITASKIFYRVRECDKIEKKKQVFDKKLEDQAKRNYDKQQKLATEMSKEMVAAAFG